MTELHPKLTMPGFGVSDRLIRERQRKADTSLPDAREIFARAQLDTAQELEQLKLTKPQLRHLKSFHRNVQIHTPTTGAWAILLKLGLIRDDGMLTMLGHKAVLHG